jgi:hypothetical protein
MASGAGLIENGKRTGFDAADATYSRRHPRTCVAMTTDNHLLLVVIDGRSPDAAGQTGAETQSTLLGLGKISHAFNLDGGGSSTLWARGAVVNRPSDGKSRPVANALVLTAENSSARRFESADKLVREAVDQGNLPGAVLLIEHEGQRRIHSVHGMAILRPTAQPMTCNHSVRHRIFNQASRDINRDHDVVGKRAP